MTDNRPQLSFFNQLMYGTYSYMCIHVYTVYWCTCLHVYTCLMSDGLNSISVVHCSVQRDGREEHRHASSVVPLQSELPLRPDLSLRSSDRPTCHRCHHGTRVWIARRGSTQRLCANQPAMPEGVWLGCFYVVQGHHRSAAV